MLLELDGIRILTDPLLVDRLGLLHRHSDAVDRMLEGIEANWGTGEMAMLLGPSVASLPGVRDWYGRVEHYAASPGTAVLPMCSMPDARSPSVRRRSSSS